MSIVSTSFLLRHLHEKGHAIFTRPWSANLVVLRGDGGPGDFDGSIHLVYATDTGATIEHSWPAATRPGMPALRRPRNPEGVAVIAPGQYRLAYARGLHRGRPAMVQVGNVEVYRDDDRDKTLDPSRRRHRGVFAVNIHDTDNPDTLEGCIGMRPEHMRELLYLFEHHCEPISTHVTLTLVGEP